MSLSILFSTNFPRSLLSRKYSSVYSINHNQHCSNEKSYLECHLHDAINKSNHLAIANTDAKPIESNPVEDEICEDEHVNNSTSSSSLSSICCPAIDPSESDAALDQNDEQNQNISVPNKSKSSNSNNPSSIHVNHTMTAATGTATDGIDDEEDDNDHAPDRFVIGCEGNIKEARRRWEATKKWRKDHHIDDILTEPQPFYFVIKKYYPHYHCKFSLT